MKRLRPGESTPKKELNLRLAVIGAEPHTEGARNRIEEGFGLSAFNCYGLSEMSGPGVAFECPEKDGLHIWEDHYMVEIIDPETLAPLPDGEIGELVLTSLCREAMPIIRYRTRDLAMVIPEPCACGRTHRRLSRITGRADDMLILKGVNIFPMQVERVLLSQPEVGGNYVIVLDKIGPLDAMTIRAEMTEETAGSSPETHIAISTKLKAPVAGRAVDQLRHRPRGPRSVRSPGGQGRPGDRQPAADIE